MGKHWEIATSWGVLGSNCDGIIRKYDSIIAAIEALPEVIREYISEDAVDELFIDVWWPYSEGGREPYPQLELLKLNMHKVRRSMKEVTCQ